MEIRIERRAGEEYPSVAALVKALNDATFAAKRALPVIGGSMLNDTVITRVTIICEDRSAWDWRDHTKKPYGLVID